MNYQNLTIVIIFHLLAASVLDENAPHEAEFTFESLPNGNELVHTDSLLELKVEEISFGLFQVTSCHFRIKIP